MIIKQCAACGKDFSSYPTANRKYCGRSCVPVNIGNAARWKDKTPVEFNCAVCGAQFSVRPGRARSQNTKYCSYRCHQIGEGKKGGEANGLRKIKEAEAQLGGRKCYPKRHGRHIHRTVAEQVLGRPLLPGEIVHHHDENKQNYSAGNLVVLPSQADHARLHASRKKNNVK